MAQLIPPRRGEFFTPEGIPTNRFIVWIEQLTVQSNTITSTTIENTGSASIRAKLLALQQQVGSGNPLTWDETGFSWDSTRHSFDQAEA